MLADLANLARDAVTSAGYPGVLAAMVAENLFPPIPSEVVLPLAGFEAWQGSFGFVSVVAVATAGSVLGAVVLYALGLYGGRPVVLRWGRVLRVGPTELERSERWFDRWGEWVVLGARVVPLARSIVSIPAGMMRMPIWRFLLFTTLGSLVWNTALIGAGYGLGSRWEEVADVVGASSDVVAVLVVLLAIVGAIWLWRRRRS